YWPANICGLAQSEEPLFDLLARMVPNGQRTARELYHCRGFVAHHNTDLWGDTDPQDRYIPASFWPMGAAWLCTHIWRHYLYSGDMQFLRAQFPMLEQAVLFFTDFLEQDAAGYYVTNPSVSPENTYILPDGVRGHLCIGPTMDRQILRELFAGYLAAAAKLSVTNETTCAAAAILPRLRPTQIGSDGRL
ncbi:alpha-L-fucosidase, partial [human gut metagenome]